MEREIRQCSSMILNLENLEKEHSLLTENVLKRDNKINIEWIYFSSGKNVICELNGEPCSLYSKGFSGIEYHYLKGCPSIAEGNSKGLVVKYKIKNIKRGTMLNSIEIKRVGK